MEEVIVDQFIPSPESLLNKSLIAYGSSNSGKTFLLKYFMYMIRHKLPTAYAFSPTNEEKHELDQILPPLYVYNDVRTETIKEIYERQRAIASIYNMTKDAKKIRPIFERVANPRARQELSNLESKNRFISSKLEKNYKDPAVLSMKKKELATLVEKQKLIIYRKTIMEQSKFATLTEEQAFIARHMKIIPFTLIVFDDCTNELVSVIKEGKKKKDETIKNFFFKGRWAYVTHWYAMHDDKNLDTDVRKNAQISVFTTKQVAYTFFQRPSNGFTKNQIKVAEQIIRSVFNEDGANRFPEHSKLLYQREEDKFYYIVAKPVVDFKLGAKKLHEISNQIKKKDITEPNKYFNKFVKSQNLS